MPDDTVCKSILGLSDEMELCIISFNVIIIVLLWLKQPQTQSCFRHSRRRTGLDSGLSTVPLLLHPFPVDYHKAPCDPCNVNSLLNCIEGVKSWIAKSLLTKLNQNTTEVLIFGLVLNYANTINDSCVFVMECKFPDKKTWYYHWFWFKTWKI